MQIPEKLVRSIALFFQLGSALGLAVFYLVLYWHDNAAHSVDLSRFQASDNGGFQYLMDQCWVGGKKVAAAGWVAREGQGSLRRSVRVIVLDRADGRAYALKTELQQRDDVSKLLNQRLGDRIEYRNTGFTASLNLKVANRSIVDGHLYITYDDGDARVLLPLPCIVRWPR